MLSNSQALKRLLRGLFEFEQKSDPSDREVAEAQRSLEAITEHWADGCLTTEEISTWEKSKPHWFSETNEGYVKIRRRRKSEEPAAETSSISIEHLSDVVEKALAKRLGTDKTGPISEALYLLGKSRSDPPSPFLLSNMAVSLSPIMLLAFLRCEGVAQPDLVGRWGEVGTFPQALSKALRKVLTKAGADAGREIDSYTAQFVLLARQLVREADDLPLSEFVGLYQEQVEALADLSAAVGTKLAEAARGTAAANAFSGARILRADGLPMEWKESMDAAAKAADRRVDKSTPPALSDTQRRNRRRKRSVVGTADDDEAQRYGRGRGGGRGGGGRGGARGGGRGRGGRGGVGGKEEVIIE